MSLLKESCYPTQLLAVFRNHNAKLVCCLAYLFLRNAGFFYGFRNCKILGRVLSSRGHLFSGTSPRQSVTRKIFCSSLSPSLSLSRCKHNPAGKREREREKIFFLSSLDSTNQNAKFAFDILKVPSKIFLGRKKMLSASNSFSQTLSVRADQMTRERACPNFLGLLAFE